jgi:hypothetical protein
MVLLREYNRDQKDVYDMVIRPLQVNAAPVWQKTRSQFAHMSYNRRKWLAFDYSTLRLVFQCRDPDNYLSLQLFLWDLNSDTPTLLWKEQTKKHLPDFEVSTFGSRIVLVRPSSPSSQYTGTQCLLGVNLADEQPKIQQLHMPSWSAAIRQPLMLSPQQIVFDHTARYDDKQVEFMFYNFQTMPPVKTCVSRSCEWKKCCSEDVDGVLAGALTTRLEWNRVIRLQTKSGGTTPGILVWILDYSHVGDDCNGSYLIKTDWV